MDVMFKKPLKYRSSWQDSFRNLNRKIMLTSAGRCNVKRNNKMSPIYSLGAIKRQGSDLGARKKQKLKEVETHRRIVGKGSTFH